MATDETFFEEESSDTDSSDDDEDVAVPSSNHMYNRYFGARAWKGTAKGEEDRTVNHRRTHSDASASTPTKNAPEIVGPSYEMLAPTVRVTRDFDKDIICNQSIELAQRWELGMWEDLSLSEALTSLPSESKMAEYYDLGGAYDGAIPLQSLGQSKLVMRGNSFRLAHCTQF